MKSDPEKLLKKHHDLVHSELMKVTSHVQRRDKDSDWIINTIMIEGWDVPFRFRRKKQFRNVKGARVNLTYYRGTENVGGLEMEIMNVVRVKLS